MITSSVVSLTVVLISPLYSDVPKVCFAVNFVKGQAQAMDYFTCKTCGFNCKYVIDSALVQG